MSASINMNTVSTYDMTCAFWHYNRICTRGLACKYAHFYGQGMEIADLPRRDRTTGISLAGNNLAAAVHQAQMQVRAGREQERAERAQRQWEAYQYQVQLQIEKEQQIWQAQIREADFQRARSRLWSDWQEEQIQRQQQHMRSLLLEELWGDGQQQRQADLAAASAIPSSSASSAVLSAGLSFASVSASAPSSLSTLPTPPTLLNEAPSSPAPRSASPALSVRQEAAMMIFHEPHRLFQLYGQDFYDRCHLVRERREMEERLEKMMDWIVGDEE